MPPFRFRTFYGHGDFIVMYLDALGLEHKIIGFARCSECGIAYTPVAVKFKQIAGAVFADVHIRPSILPFADYHLGKPRRVYQQVGEGAGDVLAFSYVAVETASLVLAVEFDFRGCHRLDVEDKFVDKVDNGPFRDKLVAVKRPCPRAGAAVGHRVVGLDVKFPSLELMPGRESPQADELAFADA